MADDNPPPDGPQLGEPPNFARITQQLHGLAADFASFENLPPAAESTAIIQEMHRMEQRMNQRMERMEQQMDRLMEQQMQQDREVRQYMMQSQEGADAANAAHAAAAEPATSHRYHDSFLANEHDSAARVHNSHLQGRNLTLAQLRPYTKKSTSKIFQLRLLSFAICPTTR
ncbi:hypothetical protein DM02DRAFT_659370 [Periconia macrospinosa]|uniref:Uncharacterized protein n=1 Tax=Periconia macrospinosa TaxID=97972 RepID=A0A2V1DDV6_9PLEO|nr:hypothetical protein DM02DRAFT_659370 [Periconia macrospinosa]